MEQKKPNFVNAGTDPFTQTLRTRVDTYFQSHNKSQHFNFAMIAKSLFFVFGSIATYLFLLLAPANDGVLLLAAAALGVFTTGVAFNIGHDAIHEGYSSRSWLNSLLSHSFTAMGANVYIWRTLHNIIHHSYTNIGGADGDLHPVPLMRFCEKDELKPVHRFQHLYAPFLYSLTTLVWVFKKDFSFFRKTKHFLYKMPKPTRAEVTELIVGKIFYFGMFLALPIYLYGNQWPKVLVGFLVMHLVAGLCLAGVFQLGHLVEEAKFPTLQTDGKMETSWAVHQLVTTSNFSPNNPIARFYCGGLNFQIEHHLFPRICHIHYKDLSKIVRQTAKEFDLPYTEYPTFFSALRSHQRHMKRMGQPQTLRPITLAAGTSI